MQALVGAAGRRAQVIKKAPQRELGNAHRQRRLSPRHAPRQQGGADTANFAINHQIERLALQRGLHLPVNGVHGQAALLGAARAAFFHGHKVRTGQQIVAAYQLLHHIAGMVAQHAQMQLHLRPARLERCPRCRTAQQIAHAHAVRLDQQNMARCL